MLVAFVAIYLLVTIGIGWYAARRVHNATDYLVAGRSLPGGPRRSLASRRLCSSSVV